MALSSRTQTTNHLQATDSEAVDLPEIPAKRYFSIGEAADLCLLKPHVLRYWETEFEQLSPVKRRGNRRYYHYQDILLIREIRALLYQQGFTISGARQKLVAQPKAQAVTGQFNHLVKNMIRDLEAVIQQLSD